MCPWGRTSGHKPEVAGNLATTSASGDSWIRRVSLQVAILLDRFLSESHIKCALRLCLFVQVTH